MTVTKYNKPLAFIRKQLIGSSPQIKMLAIGVRDIGS